MRHHYAKEDNSNKKKKMMQEHYANEEIARKHRENMKERMQEHYAKDENAQRQRERMQEHYAKDENAQRQRENMKGRMQERRTKEVTRPLTGNNEYGCEEDALLASLKIDESKENFLNSIQKNSRLEKGNTYKATVCVICDNFIIGKEKVCWTSVSNLLKNEERLSVERYHKQFDCKLPDNLRRQYLLPNVLLSNMLLSPRASINIMGANDGQEGNKYSCCVSCH